MLRDETVFGPNPDEFIPERFLASEIPDINAAFGFGRRSESRPLWICVNIPVLIHILGSVLGDILP